MKKQSIPWLFAVIILSFLLLMALGLGLSGYFFSVSYLNSNADIVVGDYVSVNVLPNQANVASFTFDGGYLPNEVLPQVIQINAQNLNVDVIVRVKAQVFGLNKESTLDFITTEHFEKAEDGYYYYDGTLKGGDKITFCNYIVMPQQEQFLSKDKYILTIVFETLDVLKENVWQNA